MKITIVSSATGILSDLALAYEDFSRNYPDIMKLELFEAERILMRKHEIELGRILMDTDVVIMDLRLCHDTILKKIAVMLDACPDKPECISFTFPDKNLLPHFSYGNLKYADMMAYFEASGFKGNLFALSNSVMSNKILASVAPEHIADFQAVRRIVEYWTYSNEEHALQALYLLARKQLPALVEILPEPQAPMITKDPIIYDLHTKEIYDTMESYAAYAEFDEVKPTIGVLYLGYNFKGSQIDPVWEIVDRIKSFANVVPIFVPGVSSLDVDKLSALLTTARSKVDLVINFAPFRVGAGPMGGNSDEILPFLEALAVPILHPFFMNEQTVEEWEDSVRGVTSSDYLVNIMLPEVDGAIDTFPIGGMEINRESKKYHFNDQKLVLIEERVERLIGRVQKLLALQGKENSEKKVAIVCYNHPAGQDMISGGGLLDPFASVENILGTLKENGYDTPAISKKELIETFTPDGIVHKGDSPIPGKVYNSVFVGLQPWYIENNDGDKSFHDRYLAYYTWVKEEFGADVIIHVGTDRTLEILKGKELAMSGEDMPDQLIGDLPHLYLSYIGNPAEAMIAKRRSNATIVGYQSPAYSTGELHADYVELEELLVSYESQPSYARGRDELLQRIHEKAVELNFESTNIDDLALELYYMRHALIPKGLHVFGESYDRESALGFLAYSLRYDRDHVKSLQRLIAEERGLDIDALLDSNRFALLTNIRKSERIILEHYLETGKIDETIIRSEVIREACQKTLDYGWSVYEASLHSHETVGLLKGLSGEYIPARQAADTIKNPEILPAGYNLYQADPRKIPSRAAITKGKQIAEETIALYKDKHGRFPVSVGLVLDGLETSRTQGEAIGQILHYIGVRPVAVNHGIKREFEIIPLEELGRPRIDVVIQMTSSFRDMFPSIREELNDIIQRVAHLEESDQDNYVRANYKRLYTVLLAEYEEEEAYLLAISRIFGLRAGTYGTRLPGMIADGNWEEKRDLAKGYLADTQYIYSSEHHGEPANTLLTAQLQAVDLVTQIRSSHEFELIDLNQYYEAIGGLQMAIEVVRDEGIPVYISDTTDERILTEPVKPSIERAIRTRVLNPKWIDGLLAHEYHGTHQILERLKNIIGLAVTTNDVDSWVFDGFYHTYVGDEARRKQLQEDNPTGYGNIIEKLLESYQRGYWNATDENLRQLKI